MLYFVEIRHLGHNLAEQERKMHAWLDAHAIGPRCFMHSTSGPGIAFRVGFALEEHARAFAEAFAGRLLSTDPQGTELWVAPQSTTKQSSA